jgi:hypothetical protein
MDGLIEARKLIFNENVAIQRFAMKLIAITSSLHAAAIQLRDLDVSLFIAIIGIFISFYYNLHFLIDCS